MMTNILTSSMIADTIEYAEYHTHKRCAAITFSGQTFTGKMSVAVGGGLIGVFLTMIDYVPQEQIQKESVLSGLFFGICLLPAIGSLIRIAFMSLFTFTEEKHAEICRLLVERNMSAKILDTPGLEPESGFRRCAHSDRCTDSKIKCCIRERGPSGCNIRRYSNRYNRKLRWSFKSR